MSKSTPGGRSARHQAVGAIVALLLTPGSPAAAIDLESLVSPGPLIAAHAREALDCKACHERFDQSSQNRLCVACHEDVRDDLEEGRGFHGRIRLQGGIECRACHTEHQGAEADITGLIVESFDHAATDFALEGRHSAVRCGACHESGKRHREAPDTCVACHRSGDPHDGRLGEDCGSCHQPSDWKEVRFDHATTKFPLEGLHRETACALCHPQQRFGATSTDCATCHRADDVHRGRLGSACADCHTPVGWKKAGFDHGKRTRFALSGGHAALACQQCHESEPEKVKLDRACVGCHRADDDHRGRRGDRCESCHDAGTWRRSRFDHTRDAEYALEGAHARLACDLCHVGRMHVEETPTGCADCHASVDVHEGSLGRECASCHGQDGWRSRVRFDHDLTGFPLLALHQVASCEECHVSQRFGEAETECAACHARADVHEGRLGPRCSFCHNPNGWERWLFDHDRQTEFALRGGHRDLACVACHRDEVRAATPAATGSPTGLAVSTRCRSCHLADSPHDDAYGRDCERCHVDTSWREIQRER